MSGYFQKDCICLFSSVIIPVPWNGISKTKLLSSPSSYWQTPIPNCIYFLKLNKFNCQILLTNIYPISLNFCISLFCSLINILVNSISDFDITNSIGLHLIYFTFHIVNQHLHKSQTASVSAGIIDLHIKVHAKSTKLNIPRKIYLEWKNFWCLSSYNYKKVKFRPTFEFPVESYL